LNLLSYSSGLLHWHKKVIFCIFGMFSGFLIINKCTFNHKLSSSSWDASDVNCFSFHRFQYGLINYLLFEIKHTIHPVVEVTQFAKWVVFFISLDVLIIELVAINRPAIKRARKKGQLKLLDNNQYFGDIINYH
jgi:hypothetical protein